MPKVSVVNFDLVAVRKIKIGQIKTGEFVRGELLLCIAQKVSPVQVTFLSELMLTSPISFYK